MSRFFVGQRVRIVGVQTPRNGCEAVIWSHRYHPCHIVHGEGEFYYCDVDGFGRYDGPHPLAYIAAELEPIVPDGHRSGDYSYTELMDRLKAGEVECV